jgi:hypothetical protein
MESETQTKETPAEKPGANVSRKVRPLLAGTMALESLLVIGLTVRDFALAATLTGTIGSVTLLAISGVGVWAAYATWVQHDAWLAASLLGQFFIAVLAGYIVLTAVRSPFPQYWVAGFAGILGIIAIFWVFYLLGHWRRPLSAGTATLIAFIPVLGFVQFWLQTDYLPRTSLPLVDVTTDLTPTGKREDIVQLDAKVTINNRSSVPVYVGATMMRITAYPPPPGTPTQSTQLSELPRAIQFNVLPSHEYRDDPLQIKQRKTLYASDLLPVGYVMAAGESHTYRKVVGFDSGTMRLARLDVDGIFMTSPNIDKVYTCPAPREETKEIWMHGPDPDPDHGELTRIKPPPQTPQMSADDLEFQNEIVNPIYKKVLVPGGQDLQKFFCREIRLKPRNVIHEIVGDQPRFEVLAIFKDPTNPSPPPVLLLWPGANGNYGLTPRQWQKVSAANPTLVYSNIGAQYSPSEQSALPGGGTPSTTQPPSTTPPR